MNAHEAYLQQDNLNCLQFEDDKLKVEKTSAEEIKVTKKENETKLLRFLLDTETTRIKLGVIGRAPASGYKYSRLVRSGTSSPS